MLSILLSHAMLEGTRNEGDDVLKRDWEQGWESYCLNMALGLHSIGGDIWPTMWRNRLGHTGVWGSIQYRDSSQAGPWYRSLTLGKGWRCWGGWSRREETESEQWQSQRMHKADGEALGVGENFPLCLVLDLIQAVTSKLSWIPGDPSIGFHSGKEQTHRKGSWVQWPLSHSTQCQWVEVRRRWHSSEELEGMDAVCSLVLCTRA